MKWPSLFRRHHPSVESQLDQLIPPEISADAFSEAIARIAATPGVRNILEIGSSSGEGSTAAFVSGMALNPDSPIIHCLEVSVPRFAALTSRYASNQAVRCYNFSSVPLDRFPTADEVERFYDEVDSPLRQYPLETVLGWHAQDIEYLTRRELPDDGIRKIREINGIDRFDAVLIDGSEFTGKAELEEVYGARFLLLDDIRTFKNHENRKRLSEGADYSLIEEHPGLRNGFAVFERTSLRMEKPVAD